MGKFSSVHHQIPGMKATSVWGRKPWSNFNILPRGQEERRYSMKEDWYWFRVSGGCETLVWDTSELVSHIYMHTHTHRHTCAVCMSHTVQMLDTHLHQHVNDDSTFSFISKDPGKPPSVSVLKASFLSLHSYCFRFVHTESKWNLRIM